MDAIAGYIAEHPAMLIMIIVFVIIFILYFIFKKLVKLTLVVLFILLAAAGYYYFKDPNKTAEKIKNTSDMINAGINEVVDKSKNLYKDTKDLYEKSKEVPGDINKLLKDPTEKTRK
jgi:glucan phosphoethanolaminetransferase (alkaline phosphatase superfamily)